MCCIISSMSTCKKKRSPQLSTQKPDADTSFHELMQQGQLRTASKAKANHHVVHTKHVDNATIHCPPSMPQATKRHYIPTHKNPPVEYKQTGLQNREFTRLKQGKIVPQDKIDFHNYNVQQMAASLVQFIQSSRQQNYRCILVICGKGKHSQNNRSVLNNAVRDLLCQNPFVIAYCFAKTQDGGTGALYVLLKCSKNSTSA